MPLKMDRFTWIVVGLVVLLLAAAVITLSISNRGAADATPNYLDEDSPSAAVYNAYVAFLNNDVTTARQYYSADVLAQAEENRTFEDRFYYGRTQNQRLRILNVEERGDSEAIVSIAIDRYSGGGIFNSGSTWTDRQSIPVTREADGWKIDSLVLFY
ncbi:MAG: hypothetical protein R2873_01225 [Caldilineaceae bacterium]|nr:hypothetical protein [Caldilineaceae bacterium]